MLISKIVHFIVICSLKFTLMQTAASVSGKRKHDSVKNINGLSQYNLLSSRSQAENKTNLVKL